MRVGVRVRFRVRVRVTPRHALPVAAEDLVDHCRRLLLLRAHLPQLDGVTQLARGRERLRLAPRAAVQEDRSHGEHQVSVRVRVRIRVGVGVRVGIGVGVGG